LQLNEVNESIKREDAGSAISSLKNSVDDLFSQIDGIGNKEKRKDIILDCSKKIRQCCEEINKVAFLSEYGKTLDNYQANYDMTYSKMINATRKKEGDMEKG